ncbi:MAG: hypothetical protein HRT44_05490 [Bdellovibrionales bacterium]|nr:hypothetical protein [Bdellovibrionales bacterium]NQZ18696.1 hypothetical protein [Bdellovibrionales bacterium]
MKKIILILSLVMGFSSAQGAILCGDEDPITGKKCLIKQKLEPTGANLEFMLKLKSALVSYYTSTCIEKDGGCIVDMWVEYCDTEINVCNVYGEMAYDTGSMDVFRLIYEKKEDRVFIKEVVKTSEFNYPN